MTAPPIKRAAIFANGSVATWTTRVAYTHAWLLRYTHREGTTQQVTGLAASEADARRRLDFWKAQLMSADSSLSVGASAIEYEDVAEVIVP